MNAYRQAFSINLILRNTGRGFCLQKTRKSGIPSDLKFKAKSKKSRDIAQNEAFPYIIYQDISETLHRDAKIKIAEVRKLKEEFDISKELSKQKQENNQIGLEQRESNKFTTISIQPSFPSITHRKFPKGAISFRLIEESKHNQGSFRRTTNRQKQDLEISKILQQKKKKLDKQYNESIEKQIFKAGKQITLNQGEIKFDKKQVTQTSKELNKTITKKLKTKKNQSIQNEEKSLQYDLQENQFSLEGQQIKSFSPDTLRQARKTTMGLKPLRAKSFRYSPKLKNQSKESKRTAQLFKEVHNVVGWDNQNIQSSSEGMEFENDELNFTNMRGFYKEREQFLKA